MKKFVCKASIHVMSLFILLVLAGCGGGGGGNSTGGNPSQATLTVISVTPANLSIAQGTSQQFAATGIYSDNTTQDLTTSVTWSSSTTSVSAVSNSGLVTAVGAGSTSITATDPASGISGSANLTITAAHLVSIEITPVNPSIARGTTRQFTATGFFSDSTVQDLTSQVIWSSSDTGIASINVSGLATGVAVGTSTITATSGNIAGHATLTVVPSGGTPTALDNWHWRNPLPQGNALSDVTYGNGIFVAVGSSGIIFTSPDGRTWTAQSSGTTHDLYGVTYGNGIFVAAGYGKILTSPDGSAWTAQSSGTTRVLEGITYGNGTFVVVGQTGTILQSDPVN